MDRSAKMAELLWAPGGSSGGHDVEDAAAGLTALLVTASPVAYAQTAASAATPNASDWNALTDMRIGVVKAALQLTADQEKYWPAIEDAIRARANNRQARFADVEKRVDQLREGNPLEVLRNRNTVDFLERRADALAQRSADLKKVAAAWEPLYKTLSPDQKQRMRLSPSMYFMR